MIESVDRAITNIFPDVQLEFKDVTNRQCLLIGTASLDKLRELLMKQNILDSARAELFNGISGNRIEFELNKQVAFMGKANFGESSLGDIHVSIKCENVEIPKELQLLKSPRDYNSRSSSNCDIHQMSHLMHPEEVIYWLAPRMESRS